MPKVKDKLWIWGHEAGSHNGSPGIKGHSRMTPAEGALYLGIPNLIMVGLENKLAPSLDQYAMSLSFLKRVVWSIFSGASRYGVATVRDLARRFPNICGVIIDDFFRARAMPDGRREPALALKEFTDVRSQPGKADPKLDLWVVLYTKELDDLPIREYLEQCDVVTLWTWYTEQLKDLERNLEKVERLAPDCRKVLGCYMWDYGAQKPVPLSLMERQCRLGLEWLREERIEGMIFLASCICDLGLEAVEWTREWIREIGEEELEQ